MDNSQNLARSFNATRDEGSGSGVSPLPRLAATPSRKFFLRTAPAVWVATWWLLAVSVPAAVVGPTGYTNDFSAQPAAADWATSTRSGGIADNYDMDLDVNTNITASGVLTQPTANATDPAPASTRAVWNSTGHYLQTRPTANRYTALMGKFVNNSGSNAVQVTISYSHTFAGAVVAEENGRGTRAYYSLTGTSNSWVNLPALNTVASNGTFNVSTPLAVNWPVGENLYLLWVDDNAAAGGDAACELDNFSLQVSASQLPAVRGTVDAPAHNAVLLSGNAVTATTTVAYGMPPYVVQYWTNSGAGDPAFQLAGQAGTAPYSFNLGNLPAGTYNLYATVTDENGAGLSAHSATNSFFVVDTISLSLTTPVDGATLYNDTNVTGVAVVSGGTAPYSVRFFLDGISDGGLATSAPYVHDFGIPGIGDHTIRATVTDARGWVSNSAVHTIHINGPLAVTLTPTNGASLLFGQSLILTAAGLGGAMPYTMTFYTNGAPVGSLSAPPYTTNLGVLPVGSYAIHVHGLDSSAPTAQQTNSSTHLITILPNLLVATLTSPTNGRTAVAGLAFALTATATVGAPLTVTNVEFFLDGISVGADGTAPYARSVSPALGSHTAYAMATDSLGRTSYTATNTATFIEDPLANNHFDNRFTLGSPARVTGNNTGASTEGGEPNFQFGSGIPFIQWGATLWWKWTAPFSGTVTIDTFGSSINTVLSVYTGAAVSGLTLVLRNDNAPGLPDVSLVSFTAQAGTEYQVQLAGSGGVFGGGPSAQGAVQLNLAMPPFVAITNPLAGSAFVVGDSIPVDVTALSPAGTVTNVSLYRGGTLLGTLTAAPYRFVVGNSPVGSNSLYAVALDSIGQVGTSAVVRVLVANVGLTITSPSEDSIFTGTNPITAAVFATLPGGAITNVDFFIDELPLGQATAAPFTAVWNNPIGGSHRLTATGRDDAGNTYVATPVNFGVALSLVSSNSAWKYLDNGSDQGTNWFAPAFDDSGWSNGVSELGYGDGDEATVVASGPAGAIYITTYFRRAFAVTNRASLTHLILSLEYDDGGVVYLNGREVYRTVNIPAGHTYTTTTTGQAGEDTLDVVLLSATNLWEGDNVLAVELHQQAANSSDVSFNLDLVGVPVIIHNLSPITAITRPTNHQYSVGQPPVTIEATASDPDGSVLKVEFFANGLKLSEDTDEPYSFVWNNPPVGAHVLTTVATDNQNARTISARVLFVAYDALGTPVVQITSPADGAVMVGPTNLLFTATAQAINGVTNVQFLADGVEFGNDPAAPYSAVWPSVFLGHSFVAVVSDANGLRATSSVVNVTITIPPTNVIAPTIAAQFPAVFATITNLTNITVTFSERVQNVDAGDLLVNGLPATSVLADANGSNYRFHFPRPAYGHVDITFAPDHGITDFGYPSNLPLNELSDDARWSYELMDTTPPRVATHVPATGALVTNLTEIAVTFSEPVLGVGETDLLVNGVAAFAFRGGGTSYVFNVSQPASGTVNITWATNHGITDFADLPNSFNRTTVGNPWSFTLDARTTFVPSNTVWKFVKGFAEASSPTNAWRQPGYDDSSWSNAPAPFFFGDPYTNLSAGITGTLLSDMRSNYTGIFLRREFVVQNRSMITNLLLNAQSDDGYIAWINGVEVRRYNAPTGELSYASVASATAPEPNNAGAAYIVATLSNAVAALVNGTNILAIQAFNDNLTNSTDFGFNAQLYSFIFDPGVVPPRLTLSVPAPGDVFYLTNLVITFSEGVTNVHAADLLVNGVPASGVSSGTNHTYAFTFTQPAYGAVTVTWANDHGIVDFDTPPKPFAGGVAASILRYTLVNPSAPTVFAQVPAASTTLTGLTSITVTFSEPVTGVTAGDLRVNGGPAGGVAALSSSNYSFTFAQPAFGAVTVGWATNHGIRDLEIPANDFEPSRPAHNWAYNLVNPAPAVTLTSPTNGTYLLGPTNVLFRATATDNDGSIVLVEFYDFIEGKVGETTNAPYSLTFSNLALGTYTFLAIATDNSGLRGTSAPVILNLVTSLPIVLLRGPYLMSGSSTGGVVRWRTDQFSDGLVRYGTALHSLTNVTVETTLTNNHVVRLGGLEPATKYYYAIGSSGQSLVGGTNAGGSNYWFTTSPVPGAPQPTRLWVLGDAGTANNNQRAVRDSYYNYATTNGRFADLWLMLGDNAYNVGSDLEHQAAVFDMYPTTLRNYFLWPVLGNHETSQSTTATQFPYLDIFTLPSNGEAGGVPSGNPKYYSFDYANIHFVGLDSMTSTRSGTSPMATWLKDDLAASTQTWTIVYFHHPPYTKGSHDSDAEGDLVELRQNLVPILEAHGVDLVMSGHSHCFERSYLLDGHYGLSGTLAPGMKIDAGNGREDGSGAYRKNSAGDGVVYTVTGSAGQATGGPLNHPAHFNSLNELGSTIIDVSGNRLDAMFLNSAGVIRDHYTLLKRGAPDAPAEITARSQGSNEILLTWGDVEDELGYLIESSLDGTNFLRLGTNAANITNYLATGLLPQTSYFFRVFAYNGLGQSGGSGTSVSTGNNLPQLAPIPDVIIDVLRSVAFTATALDPDLPPQQLTYSLLPGAPAPARIHPDNGAFQWLTTRADAATTNFISIRVTDNGVPPLPATRTFTVVVRDYLEMSLGSAVMTAGQQTNVLIHMVTTAPLTNLSFNVLLATNRLEMLTVENLVPGLASVALEAAQPDGVLLSWSALPGQTLSGTQQLARLHFTAATGPGSAFVPLNFSGVAGLRAQPGLAPSLLLNGGRAVVVKNGQPLLEALRNVPGGTRTLTLYGAPGTNYMIETSTNPSVPGSWQSWQPMTLTGLLGTTNVNSGTNTPQIFYRARQ